MCTIISHASGITYTHNHHSTITPSHPWSEPLFIQDAKIFHTITLSSKQTYHYTIPLSFLMFTICTVSGIDQQDTSMSTSTIHIYIYIYIYYYIDIYIYITPSKTFSPSFSPPFYNCQK